MELSTTQRECENSWLLSIFNAWCGVAYYSFVSEIWSDGKSNLNNDIGSPVDIVHIYYREYV